jgi:uroporphyrinogen decarboxylase
MTVSRRDRVLQAIQHTETDGIPFQINFTAQALKNVVEYTGNPNYVQSIGNHLCRCYGEKVFTETAPGSGRWKDQFGVVWNRTGTDKDVGVVEEILILQPDMSCHSMPEVDEDRFRRLFETALEDAEDKCVTSNIGYLLFERAWSLRGMENILMDMIAEPLFTEEPFEVICDYQMRIIELFLEYPVNGFYSGDDYGQQRGLIMRPDLWRKFIKPRLKRIFDRIKKEGKFIALHSCGENEEIFPDLIDIGLDVYNTVQPEIYDLQKIKYEYGKDLCFWGGVSTQTVLPFESPEGVRKMPWN